MTNRTRQGIRLAAALLIALAPGCDGDQGQRGPEPDASLSRDAAPDGDSAREPRHPLDHLLRLNHIQVKGTHNSFHLVPDELPVPDWDYSHAPLAEQLAKQGVRQVELDIHWHGEDASFHVYHIPLLDDRSTCDTLKQCLSEMLAWSLNNPDHAPLFVLIEPKDELDPDPIKGHYDDLDQEILNVWPRNLILTPDDARGDHPDLRTARLAEGWPTLARCRGKVIFQMLDSGKHRTAYLGEPPSLAGRLLFLRGGPDAPWGGFVEKSARPDTEEELRELALQGFILRSSPDSVVPEEGAENELKAEIARRAGVHIISTDVPAPVEGGYWFQLPDDAPARCNPVTAPPECTTEAVEDLTATR